MSLMAGIGQRNTFDHPVSWSSSAQLGMGRTIQNESSRNLTFSSAVDKCSPTNFVSGSSAITSLNSTVGFSFAPRTSSASRKKTSLSTTGAFRSSMNTDSGLTNGPTFFQNYIPYSNSPQRGLSEPSSYSGLPNSNRSLSSELPSLFSGLALNSKPQPLTSNTGFYPIPGGTQNNLLNPGISSPGLTFDPSEFPPIINAIGKSQTQPLSGYSSNRNYVYAISRGASTVASNTGQNSITCSNLQSSPEFSIDQDFPALPGVKSTLSSGFSAIANSCSPSLNTSVQSFQSLNATSNIDPKIQDSQLLPSQTEAPPYINTNSFNCLQFMTDDVVANIPKNMIYDRFGMIGLLKLIQIRSYDKTFEMLAPGFNIPSLGVSNWQLPGELYMSFLSPSNESCMGRPQDVDFAVPPEYLIRHLIADRLPDPPLDQIAEETLFWLFYNCCREEVQLVVAKELYRRDWRFHKKEQVWLTRKADADVSTDSTSERGTYHYWDSVSAKKMTKSLQIFYSDLDNAPETFRLSSNTLNASVNIMSAPSTSNLSNLAALPVGHTQSAVVNQPQQQINALQSASNFGASGTYAGNLQGMSKTCSTNWGSGSAPMQTGTFHNLIQNNSHFPPVSLFLDTNSICRPSGSFGTSLSRSDVTLSNSLGCSTGVSSNCLTNGQTYTSHHSQNSANSAEYGTQIEGGFHPNSTFPTFISDAGGASSSQSRNITS